MNLGISVTSGKINAKVLRRVAPPGLYGVPVQSMGVKPLQELDQENRRSMPRENRLRLRLPSLAITSYMTNPIIKFPRMNVESAT